MIATLKFMLLVAVVNSDLWDYSIKTNLCDGISNCKCDLNQNSFFLYCPELHQKVRFSIRLIQDDEFVKYSFFYIKCATPTLLDFKTFPKLEIGNVYAVKLVNCSIPANDSLGPLLQHFGINETQEFEANNMGRSLQQQFSIGFENLRGLTLRGNVITKLNKNAFQTLPKLYYLDLTYNDISFLHKDGFHNLNRLSTLILSNNKLKILDEEIFTHLKALHELYLDNNKLEVLTKETFTGIRSLRVLQLQKNNFTRIMADIFHNIPQLEFISLGNDKNKFDIPDNLFATNCHLQHINLERVKISYLFRLNISSLTRLEIKESEFENFSENSLSSIIALSVTKKRSLTTLSLSTNKLTYLHDGLFDGLKELTSLQLAYNNLSIITE